MTTTWHALGPMNWTKHHNSNRFWLRRPLVKYFAMPSSAFSGISNNLLTVLLTPPLFPLLPLTRMLFPLLPLTRMLHALLITMVGILAAAHVNPATAIPMPMITTMLQIIMPITIMPQMPIIAAIFLLPTGMLTRTNAILAVHRLINAITMLQKIEPKLLLCPMQKPPPKKQQQSNQ